MRFVWAFAIACVIAASSVCPEVETREEAKAAQLDHAPLAPQMLATRAVFARTHIVRLPVFTVPEPVALDVPVRAIVVHATVVPRAPFSVTEIPRSARGPPIG